LRLKHLRLEVVAVMPTVVVDRIVLTRTPLQSQVLSIGCAACVLLRDLAEVEV
jgi:hypothetical protein